MSVILFSMMTPTMSITGVINHKDSVQDNGHGFQYQGQNGELEPHVGGVRWHVLTNSLPL